MKQKIIAFLGRVRSALAAVVREHPVELGVLTYLAVRLLVVCECTNKTIADASSVYWGWVFAVVAYAVNVAAGHGAWRKVYYVCWLPIIPLLFLPGLGAWWETPSGLITLLVLTPLLFLICRWAVDNRRFVFDWVIYLRAAVLALLFANVTFSLLLAILYSTAYIFGIEGAWLDHVTIWLSVFTEILAVPLLFMIFVDQRRGAEFGGSRMADVLLQNIMVPALLIYMAIFALYILKIVVTWSLPRGGVAYLVFGLTIFAFLLHALRELLPVKRYGWFFSRFGVWLLPFIVLFWSGVVRRVGEYGLTQPRVYLLACGVIMTIGAVLFLFKRSGRYLALCLVAFGVFGALAYVPALHPDRLAGQLRPDVLPEKRSAVSIFARPTTTDRIYTFRNDTLRLYPDAQQLRFEISAADLLEHQLKTIGKTVADISNLTDAERQQMLVFRNDSLTVSFSYLNLSPVDSVSYGIADLTVQSIVLGR